MEFYDQDLQNKFNCLFSGYFTYEEIYGQAKKKRPYVVWCPF